MITAPLSLLSGFFVDKDNLAFFLIPFEYISPFKYGFGLLMQVSLSLKKNEFSENSPFYCTNSMRPSCQPKLIYKFDDNLSSNLYFMGGLTIILKISAFLMLYYFAKIKS